MTAWCITNDVPGMRPCTVKGRHRQWCDGYARRWNPKRRRIEIDVDRECTGCEPRPAEVGRLCYDHLVKFDDALDTVTELVAFMLEDGSNGVRDTNTGGGTSSHESSWTIPESRVHASWVIAAMTNTVDVLAGRADVDLTFLDHRHGLTPGAQTADLTYATTHLQANRDELIADPRGAEAAVHLTRVIGAAARRFPLVEAEHRIAGVRCDKCRRALLMWKPPIMQRGDVEIRCDGCGWTERQEWLEQYASIMQMHGR